MRTPRSHLLSTRTSGPRLARAQLVVMSVIALVVALLPASAGAQADSDGVTRIDGGGDVRQAAIDTCRAVRPDPDSATRVLVSRDDAFADALAGSSLLNFDSCILFTAGGADGTLDPRVGAEIDRVLAPGGEVLLLGGPNAVSSTVEAELTDAGYAVERFAGASRFETAVEIARRASIQQATAPFREVILVNGEDWADAVTSGAYAAVYGTPIVLTQDEALHPATEGFLDAQNHDQTTVVGGESVIQPHVAAATPNPLRVAGANRMGTATAVAEQMWGDAATGEHVVVTNLEHDRGWTLALAAAPLSASLSAPQLGVRGTSLPPETQQHLEDLGSVRSATLMGGPGFISVDVEQQIVATLQPGTGATGPVTPFAYADAGEAVRYVTAAGDDVEVLPAHVSYPPRWSPDGTRLAFIAGDGTEPVGDGPFSGELVIATVDDRGAALDVTTVDEGPDGEPLEARRPVWSPDGRWIAFRMDRDISYGYRQIGLYDVQAEEVVDPGSPTLCDLSDQPWSPDGQELVVSCSLGTVGNDTTRELVHITVDGIHSTSTELGVEGFAPTWSPDGSTLVYGRTSDEVVVASIADGSVQGSPEVLDPRLRWATMSWRDDQHVLVDGVPGQTGMAPEGDVGIFTYDVAVGASSRQRVLTPAHSGLRVVESAAGEIGRSGWHPAGTGELVVVDAAGTEVFRHDGIAYGPAFRPAGTP